MDVPISGALFFHISPCSSTFDDPDGCKVRVLVSFLQQVTWWCRSISDHKPEHLQLYCVAVAKSGNSGEANEMFPQETGRCARPQHPCAGVSKEASTSVKVFLSKSPHHERDALWIKGAPAGKRGTQKFSMSCATPETPVIGLPHVDVSSSWMRGVNNVDEPHRSLR